MEHVFCRIWKYTPCTCLFLRLICGDRTTIRLEASILIYLDHQTAATATIEIAYRYDAPGWKYNQAAEIVTSMDQRIVSIPDHITVVIDFHDPGRQTLVPVFESVALLPGSDPSSIAGWLQV
jgi:hypothetical protein